MSADQVVLILYICLSVAVVLLPVRWALIAYVLLSTVDFGQHSDHIGLLNAGKAIVLPLYLFWRLRRYSGHSRMPLAPLAWILLIIYAAVAAFWSSYPAFAFKLTGHMIASFVICCVFMRASKGTELETTMVLPVTIGVLTIAILRSTFAPHYGEEAARFTTFSSAQSFASLLVALYCVALCSKVLRPAVRIPLCVILAVALILDGSRIWALGMFASSILAFLISDVRSWIKICAIGFMVVSATTIIGCEDAIVHLLAGHAQSNRIAAAITAAYEGDMSSSGLGTFRFRRELTAIVVDQLEKSSTWELIAGHGTSTGANIADPHAKRLDPNRFFHNEWLRVIYEWGLIGLILFVTFIASITIYAFQVLRQDPHGYATALFVFMPAFLFGLTGENIIAGAGNAVSVGFLLLIAFATIPHRQLRAYPSRSVRTLFRDAAPLRDKRLKQERWTAPIAQ